MLFKVSIKPTHRDKECGTCHGVHSSPAEGQDDSSSNSVSSYKTEQATGSVDDALKKKQTSKRASFSCGPEDTLCQIWGN